VNEENIASAKMYTHSREGREKESKSLIFHSTLTASWNYEWIALLNSEQ
jgi:hypothetical protein